jgi:hypothetical protein
MGDFRAFRLLAINLFAMFVFLTGCSDPKNYEVAKLTNQRRAVMHQILTADQLKKLDDWINRNAITRKGVPPGVTVKQALLDQDDWLGKQKIKETSAHELRENLQAERSARQEMFAKVLSVSLVSKKNKVQEDDRKFVSLEIAYANKADKDIRAVNGVLKLTDIYGNTVIDIDRSIDRGIPARQTVVDHDAGVFINPLMEPQVNLWNTDFDKLKFTFEVSDITFKDGKSINGPR